MALHETEHWLEDIVIVTAFYGFRRSEVLGLRWQSIDFDNNIISVNHTVTNGVDENGKRLLSMDDNTKTDASKRTLPLVPAIKDRLIKRRKLQARYKRLCGKAYCEDFLPYVFVDEIGCNFSPDRVTYAFPSFLKKHNLPRIRFHDLRHSCASLLLNNGVSLKEIQV